MLRDSAKRGLLKAKREAKNLLEERTFSLKEKRREHTIGLRESRGDMIEDAISLERAAEQQRDQEMELNQWVKILVEGFSEEDDDSAAARAQLVGSFCRARNRVWVRFLIRIRTRFLYKRVSI